MESQVDKAHYGTLEQLNQAITRCLKCGGAGGHCEEQYNEALGVSNEVFNPCLCYKLRELFLIVPDLYEYRSQAPNISAPLDRSCVVKGTWPKVAGLICKAVWSLGCEGQKIRVVKDLEIKDAALRNGKDPQEVDVLGPHTLAEFSGLLVVRLGFTPAKNTEIPAYILETLYRRDKKPVWVIDSPNFKKSDEMCMHFLNYPLIELNA